MPKKEWIKKVLVIGSGPIIIGQAAEFDYAGTQACRVLKEEGVEVVLVNSNPATIMTDTDIADKVYLEPLTCETIERILKKERPDSLLASLGGQTGLNLAMELDERGILDKYGVKLLGTNIASIRRAEDREEFKEMMLSIGEPCIESVIVHDVQASVDFANQIGYPVIVRPAYTLGGTGGGLAADEEQLREICADGLRASRVHQNLIERSVAGWKEIEYEVIRDGAGNCITVCNMENFDPVGVHTGDSIVVAPSQTLRDVEHQMLRSAAINIISALGIEGGCNVQYALSPDSLEYYVIEVNPRVSRSSALASKATGYPIAKVTTRIALGYTLDEIVNGVTGETYACAEPTLDYCVLKFPRWPFDKFVYADKRIGTKMKATGEIMAIGVNFESALLKAVRSLEMGFDSLVSPALERLPDEEIERRLHEINTERSFVVAEALRRGTSIEHIHGITKIDLWFLRKVQKIVLEEQALRAMKPADLTRERMLKVKKMGFADKAIARFLGMEETDVRALRKEMDVLPAFRMVDTCGGEFAAVSPYFYSVYGAQTEAENSGRKTVVVLGSGPIRIGQGIEFDYCSVHCVWALKKAGFDTVIINNNPETVSTDYTTSDKLYFEPLTVEDVMNVIHLEKPQAIVVSLGGQTAINLAEPLAELGVPIIGTDCEAIKNAEDRGCFERIMEELGIPQPEAEAVTDIEAGVRAAARIGYPVLVRPSYVLGGRAMQIVSNEERLRHYLQTAVEVNVDQPVLVDRYIMGKELEVDAICDGKDVFIPGIMEHVEHTGIHSGDSISVYPTFSVSQRAKEKIIDYTVRLGLRIGIVGLYNIQFIVAGDDDVYVIEVNPRSSRTVPFLSKSTGVPMAHIATQVILGKKLRELGYTDVYGQEKARWYVKAPAFSFAKIRGMDSYLSPEMKSTGEAIGYDDKLTRALYKALQATGMHVSNYGTIFVTIADQDKPQALPLVKRFYDLGFNIEATTGTAEFLREHGIRTRTRRKLNEGSNEIIDALRQGHISYVINTIDINQHNTRLDGYEIRRTAVENNVTVFTALETVRVLLDVLEEITLRVSTIDAK